MQPNTRPLAHLLALLAAAIVLGFAAPAARADVLHLADGRVLVGRVEAERSGFLYFIERLPDGREKRRIFTADEVARVERRETAPKPETAPATAPAEPAEPTESGPIAAPSATAGELPAFGSAAVPAPAAARTSLGRPTRVAILNFGPPRSWGQRIGDTVGLQVNAKAWAEAVPMLKKDNVDVVVVRINSGGGYLSELSRFHRLFVDHYRPNFRTVAWVESAISAAAMSPYALREIYFMRAGTLGANTAWFGALQEVKGIELERILADMEEISRSTGRDPLLMRAMQVMQPLSATIEPTGQVRYFPDLTGEIVVNPANRVLTLTSDVAMQLGFAQGLADTPDELADAMGLSEVEWAGHAAARHIDATMRDNDLIHKNLPVLDAEYAQALQAAAGLGGDANRDLRRQEAGRARRALNQMRRWIATNPIFEQQTGRDREWFDRQEETIRALLR